jgi:hypothetical protein
MVFSGSCAVSLQQQTARCCSSRISVFGLQEFKSQLLSACLTIQHELPCGVQLTLFLNSPLCCPAVSAAA